MSDRRNWDNNIVAGARTVKKEGVLRIDGEDFKFEGLINHIGKRVHFEINTTVERYGGYRYSIYTSSDYGSIITEKNF